MKNDVSKKSLLQIQQVLIRSLKILFIILLIQSCGENAEVRSTKPAKWDKRRIKHTLSDSLINGSSYLSIYPQINSQTERRTHGLTVTVSMRNINGSDTIFINKAEYFNTKGSSIRTYFDETIYIAPLETVEIVIDEGDKESRTGANFIFDWTIKADSFEPYFEGIMVSTTGQQGLSFSIQGKRIK